MSSFLRSMVFGCLFAVFSLSTYAFNPGDDVETRYGTLVAGKNPDSNRPDRLLWKGKKVIELEHAFVAVEQVFQMKNYDVALIALNDGGSGSTTFYSFLIINANKTTKLITDDSLQSEDGTFEVNKEGDVIYMNFGYSAGLARTAKLVGSKLVVSSKKVAGKIAIESDVCDALFEALEECSNVEKKSSCSEGTWNLSNATRSYYKVASQKPGFKSKEYDNLCSQACSTGRWMGKSAFKKSFCDVN